MRFVAIFVLAYVSLVQGAQVEGIFTAITNISSSDGIPWEPNWNVTVAWSMSSSLVHPGDTFVLHMPYVYQFNVNPLNLNLADSGTTYADCELFSGENAVGYSEIQCIATSALLTAETVSGTANFLIKFNTGLAGDVLNLEAANHWIEGTNTITWTDGDNALSKNVSFASANQTGAIFNNDFAIGVARRRFMVGTQRFQHMLLGPYCNNTHSGHLTIQASNNYNFDLTTATLFGTNSTNAWWHPQGNKTPSQAYMWFTSTTSWVASADFGKFPAGQRAYVNVEERKVGSGTKNFIYRVLHTCNGEEVSYSTVIPYIDE